jgi:hypothetical protein
MSERNPEAALAMARHIAHRLLNDVMFLNHYAGDASPYRDFEEMRSALLGAVDGMTFASVGGMDSEWIRNQCLHELETFLDSVRKRLERATGVQTFRPD